MFLTILRWILLISGAVMSVLYAYKYIYLFIGVLVTKHFPPAQKHHRYAILIAARNEAKVIGNLIESIKQQDYHRIAPGMVDIFVVADNCQDNTAQVAKQLGAICYSRTNDVNCTKGFALQFLIENIKNDYGIEHYDAYIVFDADNLLTEDYITRMNEAFDAGNKIICSYRNTKNFGTNWISASYGLHYLRTIRTEHRARSFLGMPTRIQGTGFLVANEIIKNGWKYTSLTEDRALSADAVVQGYNITYNDDAVFYDEQPVNLHIAMRQRIRWAKGNVQAFTESGGKLFCRIFTIKGIKKRLANFDMLMTIFPRQLVTILRRILIMSLEAYAFIKGFDAIGLILCLGFWFFKPFVIQWLYASYALITERKKVIRIPIYRLIWFVLMFPFFDVIGRIAMLIAVCTHVEWKPIPHNENIGIDEIQTGYFTKRNTNINDAPAQLK